MIPSMLHFSDNVSSSCSEILQDILRKIEILGASLWKLNLFPSNRGRIPAFFMGVFYVEMLEQILFILLNELFKYYFVIRRDDEIPLKYLVLLFPRLVWVSGWLHLLWTFPHQICCHRKEIQFLTATLELVCFLF